MRKTRPENLIWTPNFDGEHNAVTTVYKGHRIEVYSDRDGRSWEYILDHDDAQVAQGETKEDAQ